jgi:CRISPR system Cascade subunit CasD
MQSWGHVSRFERRTTALHPTRSGIIGLIAAAIGIDKHGPNEVEQIARFAPLKITTVLLPRHNRTGAELLIRRLEDYHTVTGIRRASGKIDQEATAQTYRHYLLDARFGVLLEGAPALLEEIAAALRNPRWGLFLGRKCCIPATPLLITISPDRAKAWCEMLRRTGHSGEETEERFDRIIEVAATDSGAEMIEDTPIGFGKPIGERHAPRWIRRIPRFSVINPSF